MVALAGVGASCLEASTAFTEASKFTISMKGATKDVTTFLATGNWTVNIATLKSWTAKVTAFVDVTDTAATNLFALLNTAVTITFKVDGTHNFTGSGILTGIDPSVDAQGAETVDFSFTGTGALTYS